MRDKKGGEDLEAKALECSGLSGARRQKGRSSAGGFSALSTAALPRIAQFLTAHEQCRLLQTNSFFSGLKEKMAMERLFEMFPDSYDSLVGLTPSLTRGMANQMILALFSQLYQPKREDSAATIQLRKLQWAIRSGDRKGFFKLEPSLRDLIGYDPLYANTHQLLKKVRPDWLPELNARVVTPAAFAALQDDAVRFDYAVRLNQVMLAKQLLDTGMSANEPMRFGFRPIVEAANEGHLEMVQLLHAAGADLNAMGPGRRTALGYAVVRGDMPMLQYLHDKGADLGRNAGNLLPAAAAWGHVEVMCWLLKHGAQIDQTDDSGRTALHAAAKYGQTKAAAYLLSQGAKLHLKSGGRYEWRDDEECLTKDSGCTPLELAVQGHIGAEDQAICFGGHYAVAKQLLEHGAYVSERCVALAKAAGGPCASLVEAQAQRLEAPVTVSKCG